ncbi:TetR/AcrR family transcriptional regulator [Streptomyces sp. NPDC049881]|uniref:TetR/AcrR family transcriptional regulator n=1 Tax=unclassified Streptomyces TaxID=2593676 RepID=UPI00343F702F
MPIRSPGPPRAGRPRSEESRRAILAAAVSLLTEKGYAELTVEGIAQRAGCGKQTIYRWWPSKADVLMDAALTRSEMAIDVPDQGSWAADLRAFLSATFALATRPEIGPLLRAMMGQSLTDEEFGARFRARFLPTRRDALRALVERAARRGDLPPVPTPGTLLDLVFGVLWYRVIATREPLDEALVEELVTLATTPRP